MFYSILIYLIIRVFNLFKLLESNIIGIYN